MLHDDGVKGHVPWRRRRSRCGRGKLPSIARYCTVIFPGGEDVHQILAKLRLQLFDLAGVAQPLLDLFGEASLVHRLRARDHLNLSVTLFVAKGLVEFRWSPFDSRIFSAARDDVTAS